MKLKLSYSKKEDIPSGAEGFYSESDGTYKLNVDGEVKTQEDVDRVKRALDSERELRKEKEQELSKFKDVDLGRWEKVKDLDPDNPPAGDPKDEKAIQKRISEAVREKEKELQEAYRKKEEELTSEKQSLEDKFKRNHLEQWRRNMLAEKFGFSNLDQLDTFLLKIEHSELSDFSDLRRSLKKAEVVEEDGKFKVVGTELKDEKEALEILEKISKSEVAKNYRPAPDHQGGGAGNKGGGNGSADNPYKEDSWNLTEQGKIERSDPERAKRMAAAAGVTLSNAVR